MVAIRRRVHGVSVAMKGTVISLSFAALDDVFTEDAEYTSDAGRAFSGLPGRLPARRVRRQQGIEAHDPHGPGEGRAVIVLVIPV